MTTIPWGVSLNGVSTAAIATPKPDPCNNKGVKKFYIYLNYFQIM